MLPVFTPLRPIRVSKHAMTVAVYPGTFDPLTLGHADLVRRAAALFDHVVLGVADSRSKAPLFSQAERIEIAAQALAGFGNVRVTGFSGLLRDFVREQGALVVVRGVRSVADFEYEFQMAGMNRYLMDDVETVFLPARHEHLFVSGTLVREIARMGGELAEFVPAVVEARLRDKLALGRA